jgi:hypothetical protein
MEMRGDGLRDAVKIAPFLQAASGFVGEFLTTGVVGNPAGY